MLPQVVALPAGVPIAGEHQRHHLSHCLDKYEVLGRLRGYTRAVRCNMAASTTGFESRQEPLPGWARLLVRLDIWIPVKRSRRPS
jgi:hypothetical protein